MKEFYAIMDKDHLCDWRSRIDWNVDLLPKELGIDGFISFIKSKFGLSDDNLNMIMEENDMNSFEENGELEWWSDDDVSHRVSWGIAIAPNVSESGEYVGLNLKEIPNKENYIWLLFPRENYPQNMISKVSKIFHMDDDSVAECICRSGFMSGGDGSYDYDTMSYIGVSTIVNLCIPPTDKPKHYFIEWESCNEV